MYCCVVAFQLKQLLNEHIAAISLINDTRIHINYYALIIARNQTTLISAIRALHSLTVLLLLLISLFEVLCISYRFTSLTKHCH